MSFIKELEHLKIRLDEIKLATNNFSVENLIGRGGFGGVYKGVLSHAKGRDEVAIKKLNPVHGQGQREFLMEITMLSRYKHRNLVCLLGFCDESNEQILVYEYALNGSLEKYISDASLGWLQRLKICVSAARGLQFLHDPAGTQQRVLHRDIKSSNILLDEYWEAKISDFGLSKLSPANQDFTFVVTNVVGTYGYCDPLYFKTGILTKESDIYSFGVVLFEILCGRPNIVNYNDERRFLTRLAKHSYEERKLDEIIIHDIRKQIDSKSLVTFSAIAYQCLQKKREERPSIEEVVKELESAIKFQESYEEEKQLLDHFSHDHPLIYTHVASLYLCEGCKQVGFRVGYRCSFQYCNFIIHKECAKTRIHSTVNHPFSDKCKMKFNRDGATNFPSLCDACGIYVNGFHYECMCATSVVRYLHPTCLHYRQSFDVAYCLTLTIDASAISECLSCGEKDLASEIKGWAYNSSCGNYCYHASCIGEIIIDYQSKGLIKEIDDPFEAIRRAFPTDMDRRYEYRKGREEFHREKEMTESELFSAFTKVSRASPYVEIPMDRSHM